MPGKEAAARIKINKLLEGAGWRFLAIGTSPANIRLEPSVTLGTRFLEATSPFVFSTVNERSILRVLKLIACDNGKIGTYAKLVDDRNDTAHPNGNIFFTTHALLDTKITEILRVVDEIQSHSKRVIEHCYREFLVQNYDPDKREYPDSADQIREVLVHGNYLSQRDIEICLGIDLGALAAHPAYKSIRELHQILVTTHGSADERRAA